MADEIVAPDNAEVTIASETTETPVSVAAPEPEAKPAEPAEPKSRSDIIRDAMKASRDGTLRGQHAARQPREQGKFAGAPAQQTPAQQTPVQQAAPTPDRPPLIKSLRKDLEQHWNAAPRELVEAFAKREADFERGQQTWQQKVQAAESVLEQFKPYEWMLRNEGTTPDRAIAPLLQTAAILRTGTPAQKAQSVAQVMQQFGIPMEHVQSVMGTGQAQIDPAYNSLSAQVQHLQQAWQQTQQQQEQANQARALSAIQQFAADPAHSFFEQVQDKMLALLQTPQLIGPDVHLMSEREKLKAAYDLAVKLDPNIASQIAAQQQAESQRQVQAKAQQAAQAARAAAVQVKGAPGAPIQTSVNPNDRASVIRNALRAAAS